MIQRIVSCHQPDLFPWLGFFSKAYKSDILIILDHVTNNPKDPRNWIRRVKIANKNAEPRWLSLPVIKCTSNQGLGFPINHWRYNRSIRQWTDSLKILESTYSSYPYYYQISDCIEEFFHSSDSLAVSNQRFLERAFHLLSINTPIIRSSSLGLVTASTQLLVDCVASQHGTAYLSGDGAAGYQDETLFERNNIQIMFNNFSPIPYPQPSQSFVKGLSVIDIIASVGISSAAKHISACSTQP